MELFLDPQRPLQAGGRGPYLHPHPRCQSQTQLPLLQLFPHKLDTRLGNNVASLII